jgi:hypothetical protein
MSTFTIQQLTQDVKRALIAEQEKLYPSLESETRTAISTDNAAYHLNRKSQTLRTWACFENGPIRPVRINGRLAWPVVDIKNLLVAGGHHA